MIDKTRFVGIPIILLLGACSALGWTEQKISMQDLPNNIRHLAEAEIDGRQVVEVERESTPRRTVYSINYMIGDEEWELEYTESGELLSKELE
jgi:hypothetical protein